MKSKRRKHNQMLDEKDSPPTLYRKYHLPGFLTGRIKESLYDSWLNERANTLEFEIVSWLVNDCKSSRCGR